VLGGLAYFLGNNGILFLFGMKDQFCLKIGVAQFDGHLTGVGRLAHRIGGNAEKIRTAGSGIVNNDIIGGGVPAGWGKALLPQHLVDKGKRLDDTGQVFAL